MARRKDPVSHGTSRPFVQPSTVLRKEEASMMKLRVVLACVLSVGILGIVSPLGAASDALARFDGGIGVTPVSSATVNPDGTLTVNRNVVRGVQPPGQPWVIEALKAEVATDGAIKV